MDVWDGSTDRNDGTQQRAPDRTDWTTNIKQIADTQTAVNVNAASVVSSDANIATNVTGISDNVTDIGTNTSGVSGNVTAIANALAGVDAITLQSIGTEEVVSGMVVTEYGDGAQHKTVFTLTSVVLGTVDGSTPATDGAWAALLLYTFPTGTKITSMSHFEFDLTANNAGADGLTTTCDFDIGVGSIAVAQETAFSLTGTLSDYGDATVALAGSASTDDAATVTAPASHTVADLYLNMRIVDDADHGTAAGILEVTGTITVLWTMVQ